MILEVTLMYRRPQKFNHPINSVKYYNDLLDRHSSGRGRDDVTYVYVGDVFVYTLALSIAIFKKKYLRRFLEKSFKLFIVVTLLIGW